MLAMVQKIDRGMVIGIAASKDRIEPLETEISRQRTLREAFWLLKLKDPKTFPLETA